MGERADAQGGKGLEAGALLPLTFETQSVAVSEYHRTELPLALRRRHPSNNCARTRLRLQDGGYCKVPAGGWPSLPHPVERRRSAI